MRRERVDLPQDEIPKKWYNILPDLPQQLPPYKDVRTGKELRRLPETFTKTASSLEFAEEAWVPIPEEVRRAYIHCGRPTPLIRAYHLEKFLKTPARIYYKCENLSPGGSFKANTALPQAYWAMKEGYRRTVFSGKAALRTKFVHVFAAKNFGLLPTVFMTRADCQQNPEQVFFLKDMFGAVLLESPSQRTRVGRSLLMQNWNHPGTATVLEQETAEEVSQSDDAIAVVSSFLNHVLLTQTVIGLELEKQLELVDDEPDILVASVGSGSNLYGFIAPYARNLMKKSKRVRFVGVESETSSKLTTGTYGYVSRPGPFAEILVKAYEYVPNLLQPIRGQGIQTRNTAPILSFLRHLGLIDTHVYPKDEKAILDAARIFLQTEGYLLAPESAYSIKAVIDEALKAKRKEEKVVIAASVSAIAYLDFGEKTNYAHA